ncbi:MAG TPA: hypothetical protein VGL91_21805 [Acidobacteriota bacterium]|jgi:hypothetical protein
MKRKLILINIILLLLVVVVVTVVRSEWHTYRRTNDVTKIRPGKAGKLPASTQQPINASLPLPQAGVYNVVFERNLFCPNRTETMPVSNVQAPPPPPLMPGKPILVGVTMILDKKIAFIQEPQQGAAPQSRTVQVGDTLMIHGKVTDIRPDALVFTWPGGVTETIEMGSEASPRTKVAVAQVLQTNVVSIGGKGAKKVAAIAATQPGGMPAPGAAPSVQIGTVGGAAGAGRTAAAARTGAAGSNTMGNSATNPGLRQPTSPQQPGYMDTPFGRIQRPRRN